MDSVYLMSKKEIDAFTILNHHLIAGFRGKYRIFTNSYGIELIPSFIISSESPYYSDDSFHEDSPMIWFDLFSKEESLQEYMVHEGTVYKCVVEYRCRDSMYLLEFVLRVMNEEPDYLVRTVENSLLNIHELQKMYNIKSYNWMYIDK